MDHRKLHNQIFAFSQSQPFVYGYNRYTFNRNNFTWQQFVCVNECFNGYNLNNINNNGQFISGLIPAIQPNCGSCLFIETLNHTYSDYFCDDTNIYSGPCRSSFSKLSPNQNWTILISISEYYAPGFLRNFDYNISFNKMYSYLPLDYYYYYLNVQDGIDNSILVSANITILNNISKFY